MQIGMVTKWAHRLLTAILLVMVVGLAGYWYATRDTYDDKLYSKKQLTDEIWLYVTEYQNAGATDTDVYRYYLNGSLDGDPINVLSQSTPVLTADRADATIRGEGNRVTINFSGKVYSLRIRHFSMPRTAKHPSCLPLIFLQEASVPGDDGGVQRIWRVLSKTTSSPKYQA